jgi:hypothetical protein
VTAFPWVPDGSRRAYSNQPPDAEKGYAVQNSASEVGALPEELAPQWGSGGRGDKGRAHDVTAARHDHILAHLRAAGLGALADLGFRGLDNAHVTP